MSDLRIVHYLQHQHLVRTANMVDHPRSARLRRHHLGFGDGLLGTPAHCEYGPMVSTIGVMRRGS